MKDRYIGDKSHPGWRGALPHYEVDCERHGIVYAYEAGHYRVVGCPICTAVELMRLGAEELAAPVIHQVVLEEVQAVER